MAVLKCKETFEGRDGQPVGLLSSRYKNRQWKITTDGNGDTEESIYAQCKPGGTGGASGTSGTLPALFSSHPDNLFFTCRSLTIEPLRQRVAWLARANYSAAPLSEREQDEQQRQTFPNPADRPPKIRKSTKAEQVYQTKTSGGTLIVNSAGDPYPAQQRPLRIPTYRIEKNVSTWLDAWDALEDSVNLNAYTITDGKKTIVIPAKRGLITDVEVSELKHENGFDYYVLTAIIQRAFDDLQWQLSLVDEGFHYLDDGKRRRILITGDDGIETEPAETQLLDGSGGILAVGADPVFNDFDDWRPLKSWAPFPFGSE